MAVSTKYTAPYQTFGRPLKYSPDLLKKADNYLQHHLDNKTTIPYIEELALELGLDDERIMEYATKRVPDPKDPTKTILAFPDFHATIKRLRVLQKLRLLKETIKPYPAGAIFQLKANHGLIEAEKRIVTGEANSEPINIIITEEKREVIPAIEAEITE